MRGIGVLCATLVVVGIAEVAWAGNLIRAGGFEEPVIPPGTYKSYFLGQQFGSKHGIWTVVGPSGSNASIVSTSYVCCGFKFPAERGLAFIDLTGAPDTGLAQGVAQTVNTVVGTTYRLSFGIGNLYDPGGVFGTTSTVNVYVGQTLILSATNAKHSKNRQLIWKRFHTTFVATAAQTTLSFINGDYGGPNDQICGLDDIFLAAVPGTR